ncbi:MAG: tetratricopeptide repeat protein, partial [Nitrospirales bacterium]
MIRPSHSSSLFGKVTRLLLVALVFYFAFKMWPSGESKPPGDISVTGTESAELSSDDAVKTPFVTQLQSVDQGLTSSPESQAPPPPSPAAAPSALPSEPGTLPVSIYAILLQSVQQLITDGHVGQAEAKLVALPPEALDQPQTRQAVGLLWNNLGVLKMEKQGAPAAVPALETALRYLPDSPEVHVNLAQVYWEAKHPGLTRSFLEKTIGLAPADPLPHLVLADYLYEQDDLAG